MTQIIGSTGQQLLRRSYHHYQHETDHFKGSPRQESLGYPGSLPSKTLLASSSAGDRKTGLLRWAKSPQVSAKFDYTVLTAENYVLGASSRNRRDMPTDELMEEEEDIHEEDEKDYSPNLVNNHNIKSDNSSNSHNTNTNYSTESAITTQTQ